ncbi:MAG: putative toxin-antitoxin system toxin component, PIN family [Pseudomonadota bacterium]|nr:putative toxin-antitoxin system toxin component, PIN family [Pseudomonadota bacterium]
MNIVIDSNVYIAAFATHGVCHLLLENCIVNHEIFISEFIIREVKEKLTGKIKLPVDTVSEIIDYLRCQAILAAPLEKVSGISRDPDDDNIIALAITVKADYVVSGDKDLLDLKKYRSIPIVSPKNFSEILRS